MSEPSTGTQSDIGAVPPGEPAPAPEVTPIDPVEPYRRWATTLFTVLVLVGIVGTVAALAAFRGAAVFWVLVASIALFVATLLVVIVALRRGESWAIHAIAPICYVIIVAAVIRVVVALSQNTITVPLEGIGALLVLTRDHRGEHLPATTEQGQRRVWLAVGAIVVAQVLPYATGPIASALPFGAQQESLDLQVAIDCTAAGDPGGEIPVRAAWSWRGGEVLSPPVDGLLIRWDMTTSSDRDASAGGTVTDPVTMSHPAMWTGGGAPASALLQPMTQPFLSREFAIDVGKAGLVDGSVELALRPADPTTQHGNLEAWATYAHGDRWVQVSETAACSW